ncbi:sugar O-acetyltransferase [Bifidobacterium reuteri]|uniref:Sugar O-acetyltransferase n=1 Tax=Bifidobacterium reuteri TaxID=983706 RepID=A0A5J5E4B9_9BIFI|nr:sugar O-acetyltransferase [Bifidobacterium reuteri]KAA8823992.1 sugar O-acetyltransferase [Bifidobacterium reuteri]
MTNELDQCMAGNIYDCHDPIFLDYKNTTRRLLSEYNRLPYDAKTRKREILESMFAEIGSNVSVGLPFICDYGRNIHIGSNVSINMNCTFVDCNTITIGSDTLIASNVQLYTATHPVELADRLVEDWKPGDARYRWNTYAEPIHIGNGCWLGGGVIVLPGVTIGDGTVIGAGSVVTHDIPANVVAVGNPCRVLRPINGSDRPAA